MNCLQDWKTSMDTFDIVKKANRDQNNSLLLPKNESFIRMGQPICKLQTKQSPQIDGNQKINKTTQKYTDNANCSSFLSTSTLKNLYQNNNNKFIKNNSLSHLPYLSPIKETTKVTQKSDEKKIAKIMNKKYSMKIFDTLKPKTKLLLPEISASPYFQDKLSLSKEDRIVTSKTTKFFGRKDNIREKIVIENQQDMDIKQLEMKTKMLEPLDRENISQPFQNRRKINSLNIQNK